MQVFVLYSASLTHPAFSEAFVETLIEVSRDLVVADLDDTSLSKAGIDGIGAPMKCR